MEIGLLIYTGLQREGQHDRIDEKKEYQDVFDQDDPGFRRGRATIRGMNQASPFFFAFIWRLPFPSEALILRNQERTKGSRIELI